MKRLSLFILTIVMFISVFSPIAASGLDDPAVSVYIKSLNVVNSLGIMSGNESGDMEPDRLMTREEFAKVILTVSGQENKASLYQTGSLFPDVSIHRWSNGYIGAAVALGYLSGMPDGLFHPAEPVTFSRAAVTIGGLLGYGDSDLKGSWPYNYLDLLENLEILKGILYKPEDYITRKEMAVILERLLDTEMRNESGCFLEGTGLFQDIIVLENGNFRTDLDRRRILTDKGVFYLKEGINIPDLGSSFIIRSDKGIIQAVSGRDITYNQYSVKGISQGFILLNDKGSLQLPKGIPYYYNGQEVEVGSVTALLNAYSSIIIASNNEENLYGIIYDPVYSQPKIITQEMTGDMLERLYANKLLDREGRSIRPSQLEVNDVVYEISDIWKRFGYVKVIADQVVGDITAILPNKIAPASVRIEGSLYELDGSFPIRKIDGTGTIEAGQTVTLLLGENGKAVDIILSGTGANDHYAIVLHSYSEVSRKSEDYGKTMYFVNLLHTDGSIKTYFTKYDSGALQGDLVTFTIAEAGEEFDTVSLVEVNTIEQKVREVLKDERKLDESYVSDNVIIFNIIHNVYGRNSDASILKWSDLPSGKLEASKVRYIHKTGDFQDIDVLFLDNVLDEGIQYGLITDIKLSYMGNDIQQNITMLIGGTQYTYVTTPVIGASAGGVLRLRMSGGGILSIERIMNPYTTTSNIQAADTSRIRVNNTTYGFHRDLAVYKLNTGNKWERVGISQLSKGESEGIVTLYLDKAPAYGGKVVMVLIH